MKIAIASGKGGVGKTTVAVNLAKSLSQEIILLDCDVEEPNCHLFLQGKVVAEKNVFVPVPQINEELCNSCGECSRFCEYNAIACLGKTPLIFPEMCHSCGGCAKICPHNAISEVDKKIGIIQQIKSANITLISGILDVGGVMSPALIRAVKSETKKDILTIIDAPPGTSCPVVATVYDSDFVILVTEPTPFGLNDLSLAVAMLEKIKIPFGVVINRMIKGNRIIHDFCGAKKIRILSEIPEDIKIAKIYSKGTLLIDEMPEYKSIFIDLFKEINF